MAAVDLLTWPEFQAERAAFEAELDAAAETIQQAHAAYEEALRRYRCAPHGEVNRRRSALRSANAEILSAELRYAEIKRWEPQWD
jgi:hypothetical protein